MCQTMNFSHLSGTYWRPWPNRCAAASSRYAWLSIIWSNIWRYSDDMPWAVVTSEVISFDSWCSSTTVDRRLRLRSLRVLDQVSRDHQPLDLAGPFVDPQGAHLAVQPFHGGSAHHALAPV